MKRTLRRITAMFLTVSLVLSMVGMVPVLATGDTESQWQIDGTSSPSYYVVDEDTTATTNENVAKSTEISNKTVSDGASVEVWKTIAPTDTEDKFEITLQVETTESIQPELISPDAAVVLVIDNSSSMYQTIADSSGTTAPSMKQGSGNYSQCAVDGSGNPYGKEDVNTAYEGEWVTVNGKEYVKYVQYGRVPLASSEGTQLRFEAARAAALDFVDSFTKDAGTATREIAIVSFSNNGVVEQTWTTSVDAAKTAINDIQPVGGTNTDAGLTTALNLLNSQSITNEYVVLLSDGNANFYLDDATGNVVYQFDEDDGFDEAEKAANKIKNDTDAILYTVSFGYNSTDFDSLASNDSYAYSAGEAGALAIAFEQISKSIKRLASVFTVTDPLGEYILLADGDNFTDKDGTSDDVTVNSTATSFEWDLKTAPCTEENGKYTYWLSYEVLLNTKGDDFADKTYYLTNGHTYLEYYFYSEVTQDDVLLDSDELEQSIRTINFNVPAVKGEAPTYTLTVNHFEYGTETSIYTETDEDGDTDSGTYKRWTEYTTSDKDEELTNYTYVSAEAPTNASGTLTEDTTVTYYYTKNDDTFTENHYVQVISGWYYDSYNLVQVEGTDTVIKDNEGNVTYVLVDTDSTTDTIGETVTVTAESTEVNITYYYYNDTLTTLDGESDNTLTATIGEDYIMNLFYDFSETPSFDFTVEHYVEVVNGVYYDGEDWVSSENTYEKVSYSNETATIGTDLSDPAHGYDKDDITNYTYAGAGYDELHSFTTGKVNDFVIDESGMTLKLFYNLEDNNTYGYTVNYWVEVVNGSYYDGAAWQTASSTVTYDGVEYVQIVDDCKGETVDTVGTSVTASDYAVENKYTGYFYYDLNLVNNTLANGTFKVTDTNDVLNVYYTQSSLPTYQYVANYYLQSNAAGDYYYKDGDSTVWATGTAIQVGSNYYVEITDDVATKTGIAYNTTAYVSDTQKAYALYELGSVTLNDEAATIADTFPVQDNDNVVDWYYIWSGTGQTVSYAVEYYVWNGTDYTQLTDSEYDFSVEAQYGDPVNVGTYSSKTIENFTYEKYDEDNFTVVDANTGSYKVNGSSNQVLKLYYTYAAMDYTVEYYLLNTNTKEYELQNSREDYRVEITTEYLAKITVSEDQKAEYNTNYTFEKASADPMTITEDGMVLKLYYTPDAVTYTVEYYLQNSDGVTYGDPISYTEGATEGKYSTVYTATVDHEAFEDAIQKIEGNYTLEDKTVLTGTVTDGFKITEDKMILKVYLKPVGMVYNVAYYLYDATLGNYPETPADTVENIDTKYGATIEASQYSVKEFDNYTFNDEATDDSMLIEVTGQTLNLYYNPDAVTFNVEHYIAINEEGYISLNGTDYVLASEQSGSIVGSWYLVDSSDDDVTFTSTVDVDKSTAVADVYSYDGTLTTLTKESGTATSELTVVIDETNMTIKLYYTAGDDFNTEASYTVNHYVEVLNGFYYDDGVWVPTTDVGYHLMETDGFPSKLGAVHNDSDHDDNYAFVGYAYEADEDTSITISKDGDNTLNLYYDLTVSIPESVSLKVNWITTTGATLATSVQVYLMDDDDAGTKVFGTAYDVIQNLIGDAEYDEDLTQKTFSGYTFKYMADETALEGQLFGNVEITYVYSKNSSYIPTTPIVPDDDDDDDYTVIVPDDDDDTIVTVPDEDVPLTDIPDEDVPLTDIPDEDVPLMEIPEEEVPLSDIPQTGDSRSLPLLMTTALLSAFGLVWLVKSELDEKKKHSKN